MPSVSYANQAGESFMAVFIMAYSDLPPLSGSFAHEATPEIAAKARDILTPPPPPPPLARYFATKATAPGVFHDSHKRLAQRRTFSTYQEARDAGYEACKTCKPAP